jgi:hypothetical protein
MLYLILYSNGVHNSMRFRRWHMVWIMYFILQLGENQWSNCAINDQTVQSMLMSNVRNRESHENWSFIIFINILIEVLGSSWMVGSTYKNCKHPQDYSTSNPRHTFCNFCQCEGIKSRTNPKMIFKVVPCPFI